jgi:hypothetical protein
MSGVGHQAKWQHVGAMSALPPKADILSGQDDVYFGPGAEVRSHPKHHEGVGQIALIRRRSRQRARR